MPDELVTLISTDSLLLLPDEKRAAGPGQPGRSLLIRLFKWGEVGDTAQGREAFMRGSLDGVDPSSIVIESQRHDADIVGKGEAIEDDGEGPLLRARISDTTAGNDLITLINDKVLKAASVVFAPVTSRRRPDGVIERLKADLRRVAILESGAFPSAQVLEVRSAPMDGEVLTAEVMAQPPIDLSPIHSRLDSLDEAIRSVSAMSAIPGTANADPVSEFLKRHATLGEAFIAATEDPDARGLLKRALADQTAVLNPGMVPSAWLPVVQGIVSLGRRAVTAMGGPAALPAEGMSFSWPKVAAATIAAKPHIGAQATEKTEVMTKVVNFDSATASVVTYAGGSDISIQLLRRSSPSYRDAYARWMLAEWARITDAAFCAALVAASGAGTSTWVSSTDTDGSAFITELFTQSVAVEAATGQPASVVLVPTGMFLKLAGKSKLVPSTPAGNPSNALGTADANTLRLVASGLDITHDPNLAAGKYIISNPMAASWHEDGPQTVEADDAAKLGRNVAYYSFNAPAIYVPAGIIVGTATLT